MATLTGATFALSPIVSDVNSGMNLLELQAFTEMNQSETRAEETYKVVILKYPKSVKVLRAYVRFLREVKNDPWKAQRYDVQADNYEQVRRDSEKHVMFVTCFLDVSTCVTELRAHGNTASVQSKSMCASAGSDGCDQRGTICCKHWGGG